MDNKEIDKELGLSYDELCDYLVDKYGPAEYDYFINETCRSRNRKVSRASEGLCCHHRDEDKAIMLSDTNWATKNPFEYQKANRLVYCNSLEHLILHIKIVKEPKKANANEFETQGIGGVVMYMVPALNQCYSGFEYSREYERKLYGLVRDNFDGYIKILKYALRVFSDNSAYHYFANTERLSRDANGQVIERVFNALDR